MGSSANRAMAAKVRKLRKDRSPWIARQQDREDYWNMTRVELDARIEAKRQAHAESVAHWSQHFDIETPDMRVASFEIVPTVIPVEHKVHAPRKVHRINVR